MPLLMSDFYNQKREYLELYDVLAGYLPELIAVKNDLRLATQISFASKGQYIKELNLIKNFCIRYSLCFDSYTNKGGYKIVISSRKLEMIGGGGAENGDNRFAYPKCCIEKYILRNTKYVFINNFRQLIKKCHKTEYDFCINPFLRTTPFHLYKHMPCSFECNNTILYSKSLLKIIKFKNYHLYKNIINFNRVPVLFTDICGVGLLFKGKFENNKIEYDYFYYDGEPNTLIEKSNNLSADIGLFENLVKFISQGNELEIIGNKLIIKRNLNIIKIFDRPRHLCWKIINFV